MATMLLEHEQALTDEQILEMARMADDAPEPGTFNTRGRAAIIHHGDQEVPAPITQAALQSAGYKYVYDTRTGDRSAVNRNMIPSQLQKLRDDGSRVFTTTNPQIVPKRGKLLCELHPDKRTEEMDAMGLPECPKSNLTSPFQVKRHMQRRHKSEWETIEEARVSAEKAEDRAFQSALLNAAGGTQRPARSRRAAQTETEDDEA